MVTRAYTTSREVYVLADDRMLPLEAVEMGLRVQREQALEHHSPLLAVRNRTLMAGMARTPGFGMTPLPHSWEVEPR